MAMPTGCCACRRDSGMTAASSTAGRVDAIRGAGVDVAFAAGTLVALARGQRELIIGDRATGKTATAVDAIINQRQSDVVSVDVAVGQRATAVERVIAAMRKHGAPERSIFVVASSAPPTGLQWIAPFARMATVEAFRDRGGDALIVIDDLTKHAATHRGLALLTREPPRAVRFFPFRRRAVGARPDPLLAPGDAHRQTGRGICVRRAVRGGDAVLRGRERGAHARDDRRP